MSRPRTLTLREAREFSGYSREAVASKVSVSSKTIERWEKANAAKRHVAEQLAEVYGIPHSRLRYKLRPARATAAAA